MRSSKVLTPSLRVKALVAILVAVGLMGIVGLRSITPRLGSPAVREMANARADVRFLKPNYKASSFSVQEIPSARKHVTLLVGDSHMEHYMPRFEAAIKADPRRAAAVFSVYGGCPPLPSLNPVEPGFRCPAFYEYWTAQARQARFTTVVLSAYWEDYTIGIYRAEGPPAPPKLLAFDGRKPTELDYDEVGKASR